MESIAGRITTTQDRDGMLHRALERIIQLYTDRSHFIYELLQNAEDAEAKNVKFVQYEDRLEVFHDGKPFTVKNLEGLCDIGKSDKVDSLNQIGEFGVGFKSVFSICDKVRLYSDPSNYKGQSIDEALPFAVEIVNFTEPRDICFEKLESQFTTKFVFPYKVGETFSGFADDKELIKAISAKLSNLGITTLLFMKNLELISYDILVDGKIINGEYLLDKEQINDHCFLVSALGLSEKKTKQTVEEVQYLKFSRRIDNISQRTVDIAFPICIKEDGNYECQIEKNPYISVYFPTETESKLGFVVQGPFRTTPNRSSIPADDKDNIKLAQELAVLVKDSILELKDSNRFNMSFIRVLPMSEADFDHYSLFKPVYSTVLNLFRTEQIIPCRIGGYTFANCAKISRSEKLAELFPDDKLTELYNDGIEYHWLPTLLTETNTGYKKVFDYLSKSIYIGIDVVRPEDIGAYFSRNTNFLYNQTDEWLIDFYSFLANIGVMFAKNKANNILTVDIIKNSKGDFVAAYRKPNGNSYVHNIFLPYEKSLLFANINFVDKDIYEKCRHFFDDVLQLQKPNEYELFIKDIKERYTIENIVDIDEEQHILDIQLLSKYLTYGEYAEEVKTIIRDVLLLKCKDGKWCNCNRESIYFAVSSSGIAIERYLEHITDRICFIDSDFYQCHGVTYNQLIPMGVNDSLLCDDDVTGGIYVNVKQGKFPQWSTKGDFRWRLSLWFISDVLKYIENNPRDASSIVKSQVIFKVLQDNEKMLFGTVNIKSSTIEDLIEEPCLLIKILKGESNIIWKGKWLFTDKLELVAPRTISREELNKAVYGKIRSNSSICKLLNMKISKSDEVAALKNEVSEERLNAYFEDELNRRFGMSYEDLSEVAKLYNTLDSKDKEDENYHESPFEFPIVKINNWEKLRKHVAEVFLFANPTKYEYVLRHIRTSNRGEESRSYLKDMYRYPDTYRFACQMCHDSTSEFEAVSLFKKQSKELEPMHICLCPRCAFLYKSLRNKESVMDKLKNNILSLQREYIEKENYVEIDVEEYKLWFTSRHIAEVQGMLELCKNISDQGEEGRQVITKEGTSIECEKIVIKKDDDDKKRGGMFIGQKLKHKTFGDGVIVGFDNDGKVDYVKIKFIKVGEKSIMISMLGRFCTFYK